MNITAKDNPDQFTKFLNENIEYDLYKYKYLNDYIEKVRRDEKPLYNGSIVNVSSSGWILILHGELLLIYGENWSNEQFKEIEQVFSIDKYHDFLVSGEDELVVEFLEYFKPKTLNVDKRRVFYYSKTLTEVDKISSNIQLAQLNAIDELALMLQQYYHEEYNGLNDKSLEEMRFRVYSLVISKNIYISLNDNQEIMCFCTLIDPDIGILFTKTEYRNKGFGSELLFYCARILLERNEIVFLMTDRDKAESNKVCEKIGFMPYFNYLMVRINDNIGS